MNCERCDGSGLCMAFRGIALWVSFSQGQKTIRELMEMTPEKYRRLVGTTEASLKFYATLKFNRAVWDSIQCPDCEGSGVAETYTISRADE